MCDMTSCRISLWDVSLVSYFLMLHILMMFSAAALHLMCMWSLKVMLESRCSPKYWTSVDFLINSPMTFIAVWVALVSCCLLPKWVNSVFASFGLSFTASIQALMSCMDFSMMAMLLFSGGVYCLCLCWLSLV